MQADKSDIQIARRLSEPVFEAVYADAWDTLASYCRYETDSFDPIVSDISLGAWAPHQVATEFYKQLGITFPENVYGDMLHINTSASGNFLSYSEMIGKGIDGEAIGDITILMSYKMAIGLSSYLTSAGPTIFIVFMPLYNNQWTKENKWFLQFLSEAIKDTPHQLLFASARKEAHSPKDWTLLWKNDASSLLEHALEPELWHHLPGVLDSELTKNVVTDTDHIIRLRNDCYIPASMVRPDPQGVPATIFEKLSLAVGSSHTYKAYLIFKSSNFFVDTKLLSGLAWKCFSQASTDLATLYMERAFFCEPNALQRAILNCQYLGMLIATMQFAKVAAAPQPGKTAPLAIRSFLLEAKGWGYVMVNQPDKAFQMFLEAKDILEGAENGDNNIKELLYLKNILALCKLRLGKTEEAVNDELQIFEATELLAEMDYRLRYVNAINLSRLFKRQNDIERSLHFCQIAFDTTYGNRAFGDLIFTNLNIANTVRKTDRERALHHYVLAAIHWLACDIPEALNNRIYYAICGDKENSDKLVREEFISFCLYDKIMSCVPATYVGEVPPKNAPSFTTIGAHKSSSDRDEISAVLTSYGGLFFSNGQTTKWISGKWYEQLSVLAASLLFDEAGISTPSVIIADSRYGAEIPANMDELVISSMKYDVKNIYTKEGLYIADELHLQAIAADAVTIALSSAVSKIERKHTGLQVSFKRYHTSILISKQNEGFEVLDKILAEPGLFVTYGSFQHMLSALDSLERQHIIQLKPTTESCLKDGIRLHSRQSLLMR